MHQESAHSAGNLQSSSQFTAHKTTPAQPHSPFHCCQWLELGQTRRGAPRVSRSRQRRKGEMAAKRIMHASHSTNGTETPPPRPQGSMKAPHALCKWCRGRTDLRSVAGAPLKACAVNFQTLRHPNGRRASQPLFSATETPNNPVVCDASTKSAVGRTGGGCAAESNTAEGERKRRAAGRPLGRPTRCLWTRGGAG